MDSKSVNSRKEISSAQNKREHFKPYGENYEVKEENYTKKTPEMKPVIIPGSEEKAAKDSYEYNVDEDDWQNNKSIKVANKNDSFKNIESSEAEQPITENSGIDGKNTNISQHNKIDQEDSKEKEELKRNEEENKIEMKKNVLKSNNNQVETENITESERRIVNNIENETNNQVDDNYSEEKYESDEEKIQQPSPKSFKNDQILSKNTEENKNTKESNKSTENQKFEFEKEESGREEVKEAENAYDEEDFENPKSSERDNNQQEMINKINEAEENKIQDIPAERQEEDKMQDSIHKNNEKEETHLQQEPKENVDENCQDNPVIEEEKVIENPYLQNARPEDQYQVDNIPEKPHINEENLPNSEGKDINQDDQQQEGEGEGDFNLTDEEMFEIAENALLKVAHCFLIRGTSVSELYNNHINEIMFENQPLLVIAPEIFIEGLRVLEIENMTELELGCLMNLLVKPQLENGILVEELESIIQNAPQILNMVN